MEKSQKPAHHFGDHPHIQFRQLADGMVGVDVDNPSATATISLYGGQVLSWQPKGQPDPVLWVSKQVQFRQKKAIRGGIPICWPWFGAHPSDATAPSHGYARIANWELGSVREAASGATEITLVLAPGEGSPAYGVDGLRLSAVITVGDTLELALTTSNAGEQALVLSEGLHTYFKVGDVTTVLVHGLEEGEYVDLLRSNQRCQQQGPIRFDAELGRIYVNSTASSVIEDPVLRRRIRVDKTGSLSTAVWNPWTMTASKMDDLGPDGWRDMVCVESANALENQVTIAAGGSHSLSVSYSVESLP